MAKESLGQHWGLLVEVRVKEGLTYEKAGVHTKADCGPQVGGGRLLQPRCLEALWEAFPGHTHPIAPATPASEKHRPEAEPVF